MAYKCLTCYHWIPREGHASTCPKRPDDGARSVCSCGELAPHLHEASD